MAVGYSSSLVWTPFLNWFRGTNTTAAPAAVYVKLHTADPGVGATAAAAGSTTRVAITWAAPSSNAIALNGTAPVWTNGGTSETLTHLSFWDASTAGNFLFSMALTASQAWVSTNTFTLNTCSITGSPVAA